VNGILNHMDTVCRNLETQMCFYRTDSIGNVNAGKFVIKSLPSKINWTVLQLWKSRPHEELRADSMYRPTASNSMQASRLLLHKVIFPLASQEIPRRYGTSKYTAMLPRASNYILPEPDTTSLHPPYFYTNNFNITLPSTPMSLK
jgi:hypothetical protein